VYVNGRAGDLSKGIKSALMDLEEKKWYELPDLKTCVDAILRSKETIKPIASNIGSATGLGGGTADATLAAGCGVAELLARFTGDKQEQAVDLVDLIGRLSNKIGKYPCLIIDEANMILTQNDQALVGMLVKQTKEDHQMNIFLSTSVHSYPGEMEKAYQIQYSSSYYVEEFSPKIVWEILTTTEDSEGTKIIGMGESLASAFITTFGGNLMLMQSAIEDLCTNPSRFKGLKSIRKHAEGSEAVKKLCNDGLSDSTKKALIDLGQKGFWELDDSHAEVNETAETLVKMGVASMVDPESLPEGSHMFPADVLDVCLVPSSQALRNLIISRVSAQAT
jgi:hypothetical protein